MSIESPSPDLMPFDRIAHGLADLNREELQVLQAAIRDKLAALHEHGVNTTLKALETRYFNLVALPNPPERQLPVDDMQAALTDLVADDLALLDALTIFLLHNRDFDSAWPEIVQRNTLRLQEPRITEILTPTLVLSTFSLEHVANIELPDHARSGGFDHAAIHRASRRLYVSHTANDALDVIDCLSDRYLYSIPNLGGVAGALVSQEQGLAFTSNRAENTVGIFRVEDDSREAKVEKVGVGVRPNGLAYDPTRGLLLAANVGDSDQPGSYTLSVVDVAGLAMIASLPVPGRTRWAVFDPDSARFFVNIADPAQIVVVSQDPTRLGRVFDIPASGPHGLDFDAAHNRLFCACDDGTLLCLDAATGLVTDQARLSGAPDVIFFNPILRHLYVAIGDPGL
ncbi:MAG TPA: hypothetical protein VKQ72_22065, partial [Aggregatilineales bacterium]|nr:hypothetical protein [Aggregatilineales bacterium]